METSLTPPTHDGLLITDWVTKENVNKIFDKCNDRKTRLEIKIIIAAKI